MSDKVIAFWRYYRQRQQEEEQQEQEDESWADESKTLSLILPMKAPLLMVF